MCRRRSEDWDEPPWISRVTNGPSSKVIARRARELREAGANVIYSAVLQDIEERDARDSGRRVAPLSAAPDAVTIDTTGLDPDAVLELASQIVTRALAAGE
ncbi:MAG TPA: (d)CMP kinase [Stellaceae bacterium]|nr:(d)CMP kinase [Stellaceae bacterium]